MAEIINIINLDEEEINKKIEFLANKILEGKIVILPTSTIYGICANAFNEKKVKKIYEIKKRDYSKPLIVLVNSIEMVNSLTCGLNELESKIAKKFWPGPLTLVLKKNKKISDIVTAKKDTLGIRIDSNNIINKIIEKTGVPLVAPSANISGKKNIDCIENIESEMKDKVDYIVNIGKLDNLEESTLIKVENNKINVLREGKIKEKELLKL